MQDVKDLLRAIDGHVREIGELRSEIAEIKTDFKTFFMLMEEFIEQQRARQ